MKVFIENEAGSNQKNIYDEQSLVFIKTVVVSKNYPYPYGFVFECPISCRDGFNPIITRSLGFNDPGCFL
jgi:hypothetical protein